MSSAHQAYMHRLREERISWGVCTMCGRPDEETRAGTRRMCAACRKKNLERLYAKIAKDKAAGKETYWDHRNQRTAERRNARAEQGLCTMCGAEQPPKHRWRTCDKCRAKQREYARRAKARREALNEN